MPTAPRFRFDTNSPYAHLAAARVDDVLGPDVLWEPIAFAFLLRAQDREPWSFHEPALSAGRTECEARAAAYGLPPLVWPPGWPQASYTLEPLRALAAAGEAVRPLARELFARNFVTGEGLRDTAVVRACWVAAGLDEAGYDEALEEGRARLTEATRRAIAEGVPGVPTVTTGDLHHWGDDRLEDAAAAVRGRPSVTASRLVYENRWMRLREDELRWPDGSPGLYGVVEKAAAAVIVPVEDDHVWLVEQFRHTIGRRAWELPQGALDGRGDVPAEEVARTELAEETGLRAERMERLGRMFFAYGLLHQPFEAFLATGLSAGEQRLEVTEQGLEVARVPLAEVRAMVDDGRIVDASTVAVLGLAGLLPPAR